MHFLGSMRGKIHGMQVLTIIQIVLFFTGCYRASPSNTQRTTVSSSTNPTSVWSFTGAATISSIVKNKLGIKGGNANEDAILNHLESHKMQLGGGDYANGIQANSRPEPGKFKYLIEVISDACYLANTKPEVFAELFPKVKNNSDWNLESFNELYLSTIGRNPTLSEKRELLALVQRLPASRPDYLKKAAGACTVVLSSIEASNGR